MPKLTKRIVDAAEVRASEYFVWDDEVPGFGLRIFTSGRRGYVVQYRAGRRSRRISLGPSTVLACEQARTRAITIIAAARNGEDPAADRDTERQAATVKELADRFDREHIALRVKASTARDYRQCLQRFILPALGGLRVSEVTRADVAKLHHELRRTPYQANRCVQVISKMFSLAEGRGREKPPLARRPPAPPPAKHADSGSNGSPPAASFPTTVDRYEVVVEAEYAFGHSLGLTDGEIDIEIAKFTLHYEDTGEEHRDWPLVFRKWLARTMEFRQRDADHRKGA